MYVLIGHCKTSEPDTHTLIFYATKIFIWHLLLIVATEENPFLQRYDIIKKKKKNKTEFELILKLNYPGLMVHVVFHRSLKYCAVPL